MDFVSGGQTESIGIQLQLGRCSGKRGKVKGKDEIYKGKKLEEKYQCFNNNMFRTPKSFGTLKNHAKISDGTLKCDSYAKVRWSAPWFEDVTSHSLTVRGKSLRSAGPSKIC